MQVVSKLFAAACQMRLKLTHRTLILGAPPALVSNTMTAAQAVAASIPMGAIVGAMAGETGTTVVANPGVPLEVLQTKLDRASVTASRDLKKEWAASISRPIDAMSERMGRLHAGKQSIIISERVPPSTSTRLHNTLNAIDSEYTSDVHLKAHLPQVPDLTSWIAEHTVKSPYSLSIQKCSNEDCCGVMRTPEEHRELAMQRQPFPRLDPGRKDHYLSRQGALEKYGGDDKALVGESSLTDVFTLFYNCFPNLWTIA